MATLFAHLDRIEQRERPLPNIEEDLEFKRDYERTGQECRRDACTGELWETNGAYVCEGCSVIFEKHTNSLTSSEDLWEEYWDNRPHYYKSGKARMPGSFNLDWLESHQTDQPVSEVEAERFYEPEDDE